MNKKQTTITVILVTLLTFGLLVFFSNKTHAPDAYLISPATAQKLPDLKVTYVLPSNMQQLYDISVQSQVKSLDNTNNAVIVTGKACNNMTGSYVILEANEITDKPVLKTFKDGRKVLESPTISTMMACIDMADPKLNDAVLSKVIEDVGKSLESY